MGLGKRITWRQVGGKCYHPQPTYSWCLGTGSTIKQDVTFKVIRQLGNSHIPFSTADSCVIDLGKSDNGTQYGDKIGLRHTNQFTVNPGPGNGYIKAPLPLTNCILLLSSPLSILAPTVTYV